MLSFKTKKETDKDHAHIDVYSDDRYIGYITSPKVNTVSGKWHFSGVGKNCEANTKEQLITLINT